jgi:predicted transcriptional regulator
MPRFTAGEIEVMRILWEHGELKPAEIQRRFPHPIKNAALRSYLTILLEKGHLSRRSQGKAYYYRAKTRRDSTFRAMLGELLDIFCQGSSEALLCHLLAKEKLSPDELLELQRAARGEPATGKPATGKPGTGKSVRRRRRTAVPSKLSETPSANQLE